MPVHDHEYNVRAMDKAKNFSPFSYWLEAGGNDVVHKPFKSHEIFNAMAAPLDVHYTY
ncbi:hypothetical protein ACFL2V_03580 [Pseudomonadota bacterium]